MPTPLYSVVVFFALILSSSGMPIFAQNIDLVITGIRENKGIIQLKIYVNEQSYQEDKPVRTLKISKQAMVKGIITEKLSLEPGVYGLALLDDENQSGDMDFNFMRMPEEGFAFSNFYLTGLKRPHFEDFDFTVVKGQKQLITMKLRYL